MGQLYFKEFEELDDFSNHIQGTELEAELSKGYRHSLDEARFQTLYHKESQNSFYALVIGKIVEKNEQPLLCFHGAINDDTLSYWEGAIQVFLNPKTVLTPADWKAIYKDLKKKLSARQISKANFMHHPELLNGFWDFRKSSHTVYRGSVDLKLSEDEIRSSVRKSYKSLVNWGKKNLTLKCYSSDNYSAEALEEFRQFHIKVAERETRPRETWELQGEFIQNGRGSLVHAYNSDQELVSAIMVLFGTSEACYCVAVNDRTMMAENLPIGHWPLFSSILDCRERGAKHFDLGFIAGFDMDLKEESIAKFKKGFASKVDTEMSHEFCFENA